MPAGTEPTAPRATIALAGTGTTGPARNSSAALARCGSISQLAVFITDQIPLRLGCPATRSIAPPVGVLWTAAGGAALGAAVGAAKLWVSAATDPVRVTRANTLIFLFRTSPFGQTHWMFAAGFYFSFGSAPSFGAPVPLEPMNTL